MNLKDFINTILLLFLIVTFHFLVQAQKTNGKMNKSSDSVVTSAQLSLKTVGATSDALDRLPSENRDQLLIRLNDYIEKFHNRDLASLYDLIAQRKKKGLTKEEFLKSAAIKTEGETVLFFLVQEVVKADDDDYIDEEKPSSGEGNKWFVSGCSKIKDSAGRIKYYEASYDMWLTDNEWFINRHGFRMEAWGYRECKFKALKNN
jgi:hypothetical protein